MTDLAAPPAGTAISGHPLLDIAVPPALDGWLDGGLVIANVGFDAAFERFHLARAAEAGRPLLSIRVAGGEVMIGPRWEPGQSTACAGCAEARVRQAVDHPLLTRGDLNADPPMGWPAVLGELAAVGLLHLVGHPLAPGEVLIVGVNQTRRHRVARSIACPLCGPALPVAPPPPGGLPLPVPRPIRWQSRPSTDRVPLRGNGNPAVDDGALRRLVDYRVGPIVQVTRDDRAPFAMSSAIVPSARASGHGRGGRFARARSIAILEAYERLGDFPHRGQVFQGLTYRDVQPLAVDPATLGRYSRRQLEHPGSRVVEYRPDVAMDWAFGFRLHDGTPRLLPADVAFYGYDYQHRLEYHAGRRDRNRQRRVHFFAESSSGCAVGSSLEEAALHGLVELIERDAFLLAWCRKAPLPSIARRSLGDPTTRMLLDTIEARGFDVHVLATTADLSLPAVWAVALNRSPAAVPATYSAAGANPVPGEAVRAALWELAQLVAQPVDWDIDAVQRLDDDPSLVDTIDDHVRLYTMPARRQRVARVLGGPSVTLTDAFGDWPDAMCRAAGGDVLGALEYLLDCCRGAGLDDAFVVDCSTVEHLDLGLRVARVVVPGTLPMCFGSPQQRLSGLVRRDRALAELGYASATVDADLLLDPHPFP